MDTNLNTISKKITLLEKSKKRKEAISKKNTELIVDSLENKIKNIFVRDDEALDKRTQSFSCIGLHTEFDISGMPFMIDYKSGTPSPDTLFRYMHTNYCTFNTIDNYFTTPLLMPLLWYKPSGWPFYMTFFEIMNEFDRYLEFLKTKNYLNSNTLYVSRKFFNASKEGIKGEEIQCICKIFKSLEYTENEKLCYKGITFFKDEDALNFKQAMESILNHGLKPVGFNFHEVVRNVEDMTQFCIPNFANGAKEVFEKLQPKFNDEMFERLEKLNFMNSVCLQKLGERTVEEDVMEEDKDEECHRKNMSIFHKRVVETQCYIIQMYANFLVDILKNCFTKKVDPKQVGEFLQSREMFTCCFDMEKGTEHPFGTIGKKRAEHLLKIGALGDKGYNMDSIDLVVKGFNLEKDEPDDITTFILLNFFSKPIEKREMDVNISMRMYQKDLKHNFYSEAKRSEEKTIEILAEKAANFISIPTFHLPIMTIKD